MNFGKINCLLISLVLSGCTFPVYIETLNYTKTTYDTVSFLVDEPTTTDVVMSIATGMKCRVSNVIKGGDICVEKTTGEEIPDIE